MKITDLLIESSLPNNIEAMVKAITMASMKNGIQDLSTESIQAEIKRKFNIDIPYNDLMNILSGLPYVADSSSNDVVFNDDESSDESEPTDSAELVSQMATKGAHANKE